MVQVQMLGRAAVLDGGEPLELPKGKTSALLYYLAFQGDWVPRDEIVYLFWPDTPEQVARGNLRSLLSRSLRARALAVAPEVEPTRLRWAVASDAAEFRRAVKAQQWRRAFEGFGGELLAGYPCDALPQFATWLAFEREALLREYLEAGNQHVEALEHSGDTVAAERAFAALLAARPDDEGLFRRYLRFLERNGHAERAEGAFDRFRRQLARELDAEPDAVTVQLFERVRDSAQRRDAPARLPAHNLPAGLTPLVGRRAERAAVTRQLLEPETRLVTILAPGGMGKTRLALACARDVLERYPDGVWFVPLDDLRDRAELLFRIAATVGMRFRGQAPPEAQLGAFLAPKRALLLLDSAEEAAAEVAAIAALLRAAPQVEVLATSRVLLQLPGEQVVDLDGLRLPADDVPPDDAAGYDAVQLFYLCARRGGRPLDASAPTVQQVVAICRQVGGMPLAIELAAAWLRVLAPAEIAAELERGSAILSRAQASGADRRNRHHSIRAVFDASWRMLRAEEQRTLARTAVFRGGFDRDAAVAVADAGLPLLAALADKALVRASAAGRYLRHPLLQQYLHERFAASAAFEETRARHAAHYLARLDRVAAGEVFPPADLENLDVAWRYAVSARRPKLLRGRARALARAFEDRPGVAAELLEAGLALVPGVAGEARAAFDLELSSALASALMVTHGFSSPLLWRVLDRLEALTRDGDGGAERAPALWCLWSIHFHRADHEAARRSTERMFALAAAYDDATTALQARHTAWTHACALGAFDEVMRHTAVDDLYDFDRHAPLLFLYGGHDARVCAANFEAVARWMLGRSASGLERLGVGLAHAERLGHPFSLSLAYVYQAVLSCLRREPAEAASWAERTLELAERHHFPLGRALGGLCRGWSRGQRDAGAAIAEMAEATAYWRDKARDFHYLLALALHAEVCLQAERLDGADASLDAALAVVRENGFYFLWPELLRLRAELGARRGDAGDVVRREFGAARRAAAKQGARALQLRVAASLQRWQPSPQHQQALARALEAMPEPPSPPTLAMVRGLLEPR